MAIPRQALLRPIEITAANKTITIAATDYVVAERVYANIFDLINALSGTALGVCYINTDFRVVLVTASGTTAVTKTALSDLLGFAGSETGLSRVATYAPALCYASTYQCSTSDRWVSEADKEFHGSAAADGNLYGVTMTTREMYTAKWPWESAEKVYPSAATLSYTDSASGIRYPEQHSCFWAVCNGARTAYATAASSGNISVKGCYYVPKIADWLGPSPTFDYTAELWANSGTNFDVATAANKDLYVFCSIENAPKVPKSPQELLQYYDVEVTLTSAVPPAWAFPT